MSDISIEIAAYNIQSVQVAVNAGADRIELCFSPEEGGVTPSYGFIEQARKLCPMDLFVMLRPRGGDFLYSVYEFNAMKRDLAQCQRLSVDGVVLGILTVDGSIDKSRCKELIDMARPLKVTCHRAFDMCRDPFEALDDCIEIGFDRILTSGCKSKAIEGIELIAQLIERASGRISIMPGSGINDTNVLELIRKTAATEVHLSATTYSDSKMQYRNNDIRAMGNKGQSDYELRTVDADMIRRMRDQLKK